MTLEELKQQNAASEDDQRVEEQDATTSEAPKEEAVEEETLTETEEGQEAAEEEGSEETDTPLWKQGDEQTSHDNGVPVAKHVSLKKKLRGEIQERDDKIEQLEQKLAQYESGEVEQDEPLKRPKPEDFDTDDAYEDALDEYYDKRADRRFSARESKHSQTQAQAEAKQMLDERLEDHYGRASKLVEDGLVTEQSYQKADSSFRQLIESIHPQRGDAIADNFISRLGEGSEKTVYRIGINSADQAKFTKALKEDSTGLTAMFLLGELQSEIKKASTSTVSNAPKPGTKVKGDKSTDTSSAIKRKYDAAHKAGETGKAINLKIEAKRSGIDTTNW